MIPDADEQMLMLNALIDYGLDGVEPNLEYPLSAMFTQMSACIASAQQKHEKRVEAGRNGGKNGKGVSRNKGNTNAKSKANNSKQKQSIANNSKTIANDNVNDNVNDNDNDNYHLHDNNAPAVCAPLKAAQPSVRWEVRQDENGETRFVKIVSDGGDTT